MVQSQSIDSESRVGLRVPGVRASLRFSGRIRQRNAAKTGPRNFVIHRTLCTIGRSGLRRTRGFCATEVMSVSAAPDLNP
jgi:hypothetical protein